MCRSSRLSLDLRNFRTVHPAGMSSRALPLDDFNASGLLLGRSPTASGSSQDSSPPETVTVLRTDKKKLTVREGNRRVAAIKLIHGMFPMDDLAVPAETEHRIKAIDADWLKANSSLPCVVYDEHEAAIVDRIVRLAHGKAEKAGRDQWNAVARARHNRDVNHATEAPLDMLEKYLTSGRNVTDAQAARWAGQYPLTILEEAMKKIAPRLQMKGPVALAAAYPTIAYREAVEWIAHDIGMELLTFTILRAGDPIEATYGIPVVQADSGSGGTRGGGSAGGSKSSTNKTSGKTASGGATTKPPKAIAINDPRAITKALKQFVPRGNNRDKLVALKDEAIKLDIAKTPMAFCFVLRSMFELSANAYIADHRAKGGPSAKKPDGKDKTLAQQLNDIKNHLIGSGATKNKEMEKALHGASTELQQQKWLSLRDIVERAGS